MSDSPNDVAQGKIVIADERDDIKIVNTVPHQVPMMVYKPRPSYMIMSTQVAVAETKGYALDWVTSIGFQEIQCRVSKDGKTVRTVTANLMDLLHAMGQAALNDLEVDPEPVKLATEEEPAL